MLWLLQLLSRVVIVIAAGSTRKVCMLKRCLQFDDPLQLTLLTSSCSSSSFPHKLEVLTKAYSSHVIDSRTSSNCHNRDSEHRTSEFEKNGV